MKQILAQQIARQGGVEAWLIAQQHKSLLRFLTCGSVDDGKSTLIGRLLHDTRQIYEDQLSSLQNDSERHGTQGDKLDLALLVDGLLAEREQGITIDVAYRYFSTEARKFIIADTPGHEQYTRNMATGASTCDLAILLIDARKGILDQTRRHSFIATLLGIKHLVVAINKMDLVNFEQDVFDSIRKQYLDFAKLLPQGLQIHFVPISALAGDNVVNRGESMDWYQQQTLLEILQTVQTTPSTNRSHLRFPVQYVNRPDLDFRGYAGTIASGQIQTGQAVKILPSGIKNTIKSIVTFEGELADAVQGQAVTLLLQDEVDISRGDWLVAADDSLQPVRQAEVDVVWMQEQALRSGQTYLIKIAGKLVSASVTEIIHQVDINQLTRFSAVQLTLNSIGRILLTFNELVLLDAYADNPVTGGLIFIDRMSNATSGAGMVVKGYHDELLQNEASSAFSEFELELNALIRKHFPHWNAKNIKDMP